MNVIERIIRPFVPPPTPMAAPRTVLPKYTSPEEEELGDAIEVDLPSLNLAFEEAKRLLELQQKQIDGLDTKAQVSLALLGVVLAALYGNLKNLEDMKAGVVTLGAVGLAGLLFALSAALALWAYRIRKWTASPNLARLKDYFTWEEKLTKYRLFDTMDTLFNQSAKETDSKAAFLTLSNYIFLGGVVILFAAFIGNLIGLVSTK